MNPNLFRPTVKAVWEVTKTGLLVTTCFVSGVAGTYFGFEHFITEHRLRVNIPEMKEILELLKKEG